LSFLFAVLFASAIPAHAAPCEEKVTVEALNIQLAATESAFAAMDADAFQNIRDDAVSAFECLNQALTVDDSARIHRMVALDAFTRRDADSARTALRSVRVLQPGYDLPASIAPAGHPLRTLFDEAGDLGGGATESMAPPLSTKLSIDGTPGLLRPQSRPAVVQVISASGAVVWTGYLGVGDPAPSWPALGLPEALINDAPVEYVVIKDPRPKRLAWAAAATGLLSGGLYLASAVSHGHYADLTNADISTIEELDAQQNRTNLLAYGAIGTGVGAMTLGVSGLVMARW
jgi:hypothetical protein